MGRHHPLGNIPTGHRWDRIAMDILDVCDPTPEGFRYILVIADYFSKCTEAFPMKNKCADTVADILVENIIYDLGCHWLYIATRAENSRLNFTEVTVCFVGMHEDPHSSLITQSPTE